MRPETEPVADIPCILFFSTVEKVGRTVVTHGSVPDGNLQKKRGKSNKLPLPCAFARCTNVYIVCLSVSLMRPPYMFAARVLVL